MYSFSGDIRNQTLRWKKGNIELPMAMGRCQCMIENKYKLKLIIITMQSLSYRYECPISKIIDPETWYDLNKLSYVPVTLKRLFFFVP